jgi:alpha-N-arabinofuranosidase
MKRTPIAFAIAWALAATLHAAEFHVATTGKDSNPGTQAAPLRTIQRAADLAQPADTITVHGGVYRERINPPRGGRSDSERIVYQAAPGEKVVIKGSEEVRNWEMVQNDAWKVVLPNSFFGKFNPYSDLIHGDWFDPRGRQHHTGAVYLEGQWMAEAAKLDEVLNPAPKKFLWFAQVDEKNTTIWAQFKGIDPNRRQVEINVRQTVFYPDQPGRNYLTVRGFTLRDAATPWAPPTAEQIGLIGTHWSKGWIIENNTVSHSVCSGISLGKHGDQFDNTSADTAEGYVKTIERGLARGWNKDTIGHHIVRNNTVAHCEQAGIVGSLGPAFSVVTDNVIHDIHVRRLFSGAEMAGIKFHAAIDVEIRRNHIHNTCRGLWLDWMAQGTRVSQNLFHENLYEDLFVEVDHGPFLVDNNFFLSGTALLDMSEGGAYAHNLFAGRIVPRPELSRETPFHKPHSTEIAGLRNIVGGDDRFYNNLFVAPAGLADYDGARLPVFMSGNVYLAGAKPSKHEKDPVVGASPDSKTAPAKRDVGGLRVVRKADGFYLTLPLDKPLTSGPARKLVTTELLGKAAIPGLPYEQPDGTAIRVERDYFGKPRSETNPTPGPIENPGSGPVTVKVR